MSFFAQDPLGQPWQVVIHAEMAAAVTAVANEVAGRLADESCLKAASELAVQQSQFPQLLRARPCSVSAGNMGLAILCSALDACFSEAGWDVVGHQHIQLAGRQLASSSTLKDNLSIFSGLSGVAFATWLLSRKGTRYQKLLATIEQYLLPEVTALAEGVLTERPHGCSDSLYDVISGLSGMGAYLLCRKDDEAAAWALQRVLASLIYLAEEQDDLPHWHVPAHLVPQQPWYQHYLDGYLNCGLSHGIPGPLALLSLARLQGVEAPGIEAAIAHAADWLVAHHLEDEWGINWPTMWALGRWPDESPSSRGARTAWCYGIPGVARALWLAGRALARADYQEIAIAGMQAVYRQPLAVRSIFSPSFCHGVAGLLQITLRFANESSEPCFREAATALSQQLLDLYQPDAPLGYRHLETANVLVDNPWLLDGVTGTVLVLLAAATSHEPVWDRLFLLA